MDIGFDEIHFGIKVIVRRPSFLDWLFGREAVVEFVIVYEVDGPTKVVADCGAKVILVQGPHDRT